MWKTIGPQLSYSVEDVLVSFGLPEANDDSFYQTIVYAYHCRRCWEFWSEFDEIECECSDMMAWEVWLTSIANVLQHHLPKFVFLASIRLEEKSDE